MRRASIGSVDWGSALQGGHRRQLVTPAGRASRAQPVEFGSVRQFALPEQVADLFVGGLARELVNLIAAIDETAFFAEDVTDGGRGDHNAVEALRRYGGRSWRGCGGDVGTEDIVVSSSCWKR